jgi:predicted amidophosphoribosyltransferase
MTELLEQAIAKLKTQPVDQQDAIATLILAELEDDRRWDESFARSPDLLARLAAEAMEEYHSGKTRELNLEISSRLWNTRKTALNLKQIINFKQRMKERSSS